MAGKEIDYFTVENESVGDEEVYRKRFNTHRGIRRKSTSRCSLYVFIIFLLAIIAYLVLAPTFINTTMCNEDDLGPMTKASYDMLKALCPHVRDSQLCQYRFDLSTGKCYETGEKGPCSSNMKFFMKENGGSPFGQCECDFDGHLRQLVLDQKGENCYFIFEQGYCAEGQWLNIKSNESETRIVCEDTICIEKKEEEVQVPLEVIDKNGLPHQACVALGETSQFCRNPHNPNASMIVGFTAESLYAKCIPDNRDGPRAEASIAGFGTRKKRRMKCKVRRIADQMCLSR